MVRVLVTLHPKEMEALHLLSERERRDPRAQAAILIRETLERLELLPPADHTEQEASHGVINPTIN